MIYVIRALSLASDNSPIDGFVRHFDPDAHDGQGFVEFTRDPLDAIQFSTAPEAMALWKMQSNLKPIREDGKPNRPLTAFNVQIVRLLPGVSHE